MWALRHEVHHRRVPNRAIVRWAMPARAAAFRRLTFLLLVCFLPSGCATLTIPAIDPSGNRIFAPVPTQVTLPQLHGPTGTSILPNPSFPEPPVPPACLQGPPPPSTVKPVAVRSSDERGRCGQILLTPTRIVAPVGGEVVLIAGLCGEDGYFVSGEPIEWMLAPDSVGEIIEVGDDMKGKRRSMWHRSAKPAVEKLDVDFAKGRTSSEAGRITRGSLRESDDLIIKKGQTWVSLSSPTEGLSRVTVLAPESDVWDRRRQTATIYWIDASWQFPGPQALRVGEVATLVTQVKKAEGFVPAEGWIVKYRLLTDGFGQFLNARPEARGIDSRVDADSKAVAQLINSSNQPGTAVVSIEIVSPERRAEKMPELPIATGQTMITWSAPILDLQVTGRETALVGEPVDYRIAVTNMGDIAAENVRLVMDLKNGGLQAEYLHREPTQRTTAGAVWSIGLIPPRSIVEAVVRITPTAESDNRIEFTSTATPNLSKTAIMPLLAVRPQIDLKFAPSPGMEQVEVGRPVVLDVVATNTGRQTLNGLNLLVDTTPGLQHAEGGGNRIQRTIPILGPGQSQSLPLRFVVQKVGDLSAKLIAQVGGVTLGERQAFIRGIEATARQPAMALRLFTANGSTTVSPNQEVDVRCVVQNPGQTLLTNIQVAVEHESSLAMTKASANVQYRPEERVARWIIPSLEAGNQIAFDLGFRAIAAAPPPAMRMTARSGEGHNAQEVLTFNSGSNAPADPPIFPSTPGDQNIMPPPSGGGLPPFGTGNNPWSLTIQPVEQRVALGQNGRYRIFFQNNRQQPDQDVRVEIILPQGVDVIGINAADGSVVNATFSQDRRSIVMEPIRFLRPGDSIDRLLDLRHNLAGNHNLEVILRSAADPQGISQRSTISVVPNP